MQPKFLKHAPAYAKAVVHKLRAHREVLGEMVSGSERNVPSVIQSRVHRAHQGRKTGAHIGRPPGSFVLSGGQVGKRNQQRLLYIHKLETIGQPQGERARKL